LDIKLSRSVLPSASQGEAVPALPLNLIKPADDRDIEFVKNSGRSNKIQEAVAAQNVLEHNKDAQREIMQRVSELASLLDRDLKFEIHEDAGIVQIQVIDTNDGRIVRKIPADEVLKLVSQIREKMSERLDVRV
jgi:uncharacterized FlaG/YvyC family protein